MDAIQEHQPTADAAIRIKLDGREFCSFLQRLGPEARVDVFQVTNGLFRVELDPLPTDAGELIARLYPSDSLIRRVAAFRAGDGNLPVIDVD